MKTIAPSLRRIVALGPADSTLAAGRCASSHDDVRAAGIQDFFSQIADAGFDSVLAPMVEDGCVQLAYHGQQVCLELRQLCDVCRQVGLSILIDTAAPAATDNDRDTWVHLLATAADAGVSGVRCLQPGRLEPEQWNTLLATLRQRVPRFLVTAWAPGMSAAALGALRGIPFDACFSSMAWWDQRAAWLVEEQQRLRDVAPVVATVTQLLASDQAIDPRTFTSTRDAVQRLWAAAYMADGLIVAAERALALPACVREANTWVESAPTRQGRLMSLSGPLSSNTVLFWQGGAPCVLILHHRHAQWRKQMEMIQARLPDGFLLPEAAFQQADITPQHTPVPGLVSLIPVERSVSSRSRTRRADGNAPAIDTAVPDTGLGPGAYQALKSAMTADRIAIEDICPRVDDGRFAVKITLGRTVRVSADVFMDGHAPLAASVLWRAADEPHWHRVSMRAVGNDRWQAEFVPRRLGRHYYTVQAWAHPDAPQYRSAHCAVFPLQVDRHEAEFSSWYELFPRSMGPPGEHGTLKDVIPRLPAIRAMGFDVLYFPPIHPIGLTNRKGRNNSLKAEPGDPGSPYAIGSESGGHEALHPELGTLDDFRELLAAARMHDLEIALDFAIQCSPDHPWLRQHPEWFRWREDGTVQYAENPPKRYEDIVNPDFYSETASGNQRMGLWRALRDIVMFWADEGVRTFRVDNPHTKPLPFWEWMIGEVQKRYPEAIFLSEAFTRPKMMYRLAKLGFSQSYTYFTWRNDKAELTDYLTELASQPQADYFRPHFFVNTPDINPYFLQGSGRPGFLIRAALATTTSGLWGMYSGFELCESRPIPGKEEYLDSEKYELRTRDWEQPGNIVAEITRLNAIRRANPALQTHRRIRFHDADDSRVLFFSKATPEGDNIVLVAINLDPHASVTTTVHVPSWVRASSDRQGLRLRTLWDDRESVLGGADMSLTLTPEQPFVLWSVWP